MLGAGLPDDDFDSIGSADLQGSEGCKADVLVQHVDLSDADLPQQVELER
jgi:hypothetical protein